MSYLIRILWIYIWLAVALRLSLSGTLGGLSFTTSCHSDRIPAGPTYLSAPHPPPLPDSEVSIAPFLTDSLFGGSIGCQEVLFIESLQEDLRLLACWLSMTKIGPWETHNWSPWLVGMQCGPELQVLHHSCCPLCSLGSWGKIQPVTYLHWRRYRKAPQEFPCSPSNGILEAPIISLEVRKKYKYLKFSNLQHSQPLQC